MRRITVFCIVILFGVLLLQFTQVKATEISYWAKAYGGTSDDVAKSVAVLSNGDIVVAGVTKSFGAGGTDLWVLKLDPNGNIIWQKTYGSIYNDGSLDALNYDRVIVKTWRQDIILIGDSSDPGYNYGIWVLKLNPEGDVIWQKIYRGKGIERPEDATITLTGDIVIGGYILNPKSGSYDALVLKLDPNGNIIWQKTYGGDSDDWIGATTVDKEGNVIVAGYTKSFGAGGMDAWILKLDPNGNIIWKRTFGGYNNEAFNAVVYDDGYIVAAGWTRSFSVDDWNIWVIKLNSNGDIIWQRTYGGNNNEAATAIATTSIGDIVITGWTYSFGAGKQDIWILKLDPNGNIIWQRTYGGGGKDKAYGIFITNEGNIYVAGVTESFGAGGMDALVLKLPPDGRLECFICNSSNAQVRFTNAKITSPVIKISSPELQTGRINLQTKNTKADVTSMCSFVLSTTPSLTTSSAPSDTATPTSGNSICGPGLVVLLGVLSVLLKRKKK